MKQGCVLISLNLLCDWECIGENNGIVWGMQQRKGKKKIESRDNLEHKLNRTL